MKEYQFKNRDCPVCGKEVTPYSYVFDKRDRKIHVECEQKLTPQQEDLILTRHKEE